MPRIDRENPIQRAIIDFLRQALPGCLIHHSPNELGMSGPAAARQIAKAKHNGMLPGFPDLVVAHDGGILFLEVKAEGNYLTENQRAVHDALAAMGHRISVVRSIDDTKEMLGKWGVVHG